MFSILCHDSLLLSANRFCNFTSWQHVRYSVQLYKYNAVEITYNFDVTLFTIAVLLLLKMWDIFQKLYTAWFYPLPLLLCLLELS